MLNLSKSVCMLFDEKGRKIDFKLNVNEIELHTVEYTKFLGVWIDRKLKWDVHVGKLILKIKRNIHLLCTGQNMLNIHAKKLIYYGHIQSHLTYCLSIWGNLICDTLLNKLQKLQNKCIYYIKGKSNMSSVGIS